MYNNFSELADRAVHNHESRLFSLTVDEPINEPNSSKKGVKCFNVKPN